MSTIKLLYFNIDRGYILAADSAMINDLWKNLKKRIIKLPFHFCSIFLLCERRSVLQSAQRLLHIFRRYLKKIRVRIVKRVCLRIQRFLERNWKKTKRRNILYRKCSGRFDIWRKCALLRQGIFALK